MSGYTGILQKKKIRPKYFFKYFLNFSLLLIKMFSNLRMQPIIISKLNTFQASPQAFMIIITFCLYSCSRNGGCCIGMVGFIRFTILATKFILLYINGANALVWSCRNKFGWLPVFMTFMPQIYDKNIW